MSLIRNRADSHIGIEFSVHYIYHIESDLLHTMLKFGYVPIRTRSLFWHESRALHGCTAKGQLPWTADLNWELWPLRKVIVTMIKVF